MKFPQQITFWGYRSHDGFGFPKFDKPVILLARWEDKTELFYNSAGEELRSKSVIYVPSVIAVESYVMLGIATGLDPLVIPSAYRVHAICVIGNLSNTQQVIKIWT